MYYHKSNAFGVIYCQYPISHSKYHAEVSGTETTIILKRCGRESPDNPVSVESAALREEIIHPSESPHLNAGPGSSQPISNTLAACLGEIPLSFLTTDSVSAGQ